MPLSTDQETQECNVNNDSNASIDLLVVYIIPAGCYIDPYELTVSIAT